MSTSISHSTVVPLIPRGRAQLAKPQFSSWSARLRRLFAWLDKARQRDALRAIADNQHLLNDIGLTRREALDESDRPFWH